MSREAVGQSGHHRGIPRDGGRGVEEVDVEVSGPGGEFGCQHTGLAEPPDAVGRGITQEVPEPETQAGHVPAGIAPEGAHVTGDHPEGGTGQVLREIQDRGLDLVVHRVADPVVRPAQRDDGEGDAMPLEGRDLLSNEGFGYPRVALDDYDQHGCAPKGGAAHAGTGASCRRGPQVPGPWRSLAAPARGDRGDAGRSRTVIRGPASTPSRSSATVPPWH
jgi:hypothetical protein